MAKPSPHVVAQTQQYRQARPTRRNDPPRTGKVTRQQPIETMLNAKVNDGRLVRTERGSFMLQPRFDKRKK